MKICTKCKIPQNLDQFRTDNTRHDCKSPTCNTCNNIHQRSWYEKNKEKARKQARESYERRKKQVSESRKIDRKNNPEKWRSAARKRYDPIKGKMSSWKQAGIKNMTIERYNIMLETQNHSCAICKRHKNEFKRMLNVDHNHLTGEVRGLLCDSCNRGIGYLKESIEILDNAKIYLYGI